uniref:uncharacterized protein LOC120343910 n=1 Tax=Styela clava TaxID=7725 RepID=UPI00193ACEB0|nr:uncharacterized protein LOC120343910 [Styela clava]
MKSIIFISILTMFGIGLTEGRIHLLPITDDERPVIVLTSFGYLKGGYLEVNITSLTMTGANQQAVVGFSFDKSSSSGTSSYVEREESTRGCVLNEKSGTETTFENVPRALLKIVQDSTGGSYKLEVKERGLYGLQFYETKKAYADAHPSVAAAQSQDKVETPTTSITPTTKTTTTTEKAEENKPDTKPDATSNEATSRRKKRAAIAGDATKEETDATKDNADADLSSHSRELQ